MVLESLRTLDAVSNPHRHLVRRRPRLYGVVFVRSVRAVPTQGSLLMKLIYLYVLFLWYAIWLRWLPRLHRGRWDEWVAWVAVVAGLGLLLSDMLTRSSS